MGFHIPDSPRLTRPTHSVSVGTSMLTGTDSGTESPPPSTESAAVTTPVGRRVQRRNAMIPVRLDNDGAPPSSVNLSATDARWSLLIFHQQLRARGELELQRRDSAKSSIVSQPSRPSASP
ncbi:hypothetical protein PINS_up003972 [Pythium insidiosum]|nr:hypothetical protein PINS_up003972 [Pythium insidiosum]